MKIILIVQLFNEIESGFLEQFCEFNEHLFDKVIILDDGSYDGTKEYCLEKNFTVIENTKNDFQNELSHKMALIEKANEFHPDFIVSLDADEILVTTREKLEKICETLNSSQFDGYSANFVNLWRSKHYKRTDSLFDAYKPVKLWKHRMDKKPFTKIERGLHQRLYPEYIEQAPFCPELLILHLGFTSKKYIVDKFVRYRSLGQSGQNLMRFLDESKLTIERVDAKYLPAPWKTLDQKPKKITIRDYFTEIEASRSALKKPKITIFSLIYRDINWLQFLYDQFIKYTEIDDVEFYFVTNNADENVVNYLEENYIPYWQYKSTESERKEPYINNVYRAYNFGVSKARGDFVVLLNSDMAFSNGWLVELLKIYSPKTCVSSRLVEQGKLRTGKYGIEKNFGDSWQNYDENGFQNYADALKISASKPGGLYMPLLIKKSDFNLVGGYPAGNVVPKTDIFNPKIANLNQELISGDVIFIEKLKSVGIEHVTSLSSIVYHFQEGERRATEAQEKKNDAFKIAICNDMLTGIHGEKVLWDHLLQLPNTIGIDFNLAEGKTPNSFKNYLEKNDIKVDLVIQNASFIKHIFPKIYTIMFLQDNLRSMQNTSTLQEKNLISAQCLVTNSIDTASAYPEFDFDIHPVGIDHQKFVPLNKKQLKAKYRFEQHKNIGIFVGALNNVKGWPEVLEIINRNRDIFWIVVTKYNHEIAHPRVQQYSNIDHNKLVELLNCSDFFILGSNVETQCLAALEAALCDIPVVMKPVGIFSSLTKQQRDRIGCITNNLEEGIRFILAGKSKFQPRKTVLELNINLKDIQYLWWKKIAEEKMKILKLKHEKLGQNEYNVNFLSQVRVDLELFYRFYILKPIIKRDTFYSIAELSVFLKQHIHPVIYNSIRYIWKRVRRS